MLAGSRGPVSSRVINNAARPEKLDHNYYNYNIVEQTVCVCVDGRVLFLSISGDSSFFVIPKYAEAVCVFRL